MHKEHRSLFDLDEEISIEVPVTVRVYLRRARHSCTHRFTCTRFDRRWRAFLDQEEEAVLAKHLDVDAAIESLFALPSDSDSNSISEECSSRSSDSTQRAVCGYGRKR